MNYDTLTRSQLLKAEAKADVERSAVVSEMIRVGRGHELHSETVARAKGANPDALSLRFLASSQTCGAIYQEKQARVTYHGSLHRIKLKLSDIYI